MSRRVKRSVITLLWLAFALYPLLSGWSYYTTPLRARVDHPLHELYRPTGIVGHGLGIVGTLMILLGVGLYMLRKRWTFMHRFGRLSSWLSFHIFMCTLGPFFVVLHTTFKIGNIVSIAFWSMVIVVVSGLFGRYVHAHIPKFEDGHFFTEGDIRRAKRRVLQEVASQTGLSTDYLQQLFEQVVPEIRISALLQALMFMARSDFLIRRYTRRIEQQLFRQLSPASSSSIELREPLEHYVRLSLQGSVLMPLQKAFGYWHTLHFPLAATMFLILGIHVGVAIAFGYTWIF